MLNNQRTQEKQDGKKSLSGKQLNQILMRQVSVLLKLHFQKGSTLNNNKKIFNKMNSYFINITKTLNLNVNEIIKNVNEIISNFDNHISIKKINSLKASDGSFYPIFVRRVEYSFFIKSLY